MDESTAKDSSDCSTHLSSEIFVRSHERVGIRTLRWPHLRGVRKATSGGLCAQRKEQIDFQISKGRVLCRCVQVSFLKKIIYCTLKFWFYFFIGQFNIKSRFHCSLILIVIISVYRRLETVLPGMDQEHNLMVICHQAVIRCILAFLLNTPGDELPYIKVPLHCILKVTFSEGQNHIDYHHLPIECVDTYRPKMDLSAKETKSSSTTPEDNSPAKRQRGKSFVPTSNKENMTYAIWIGFSFFICYFLVPYNYILNCVFLN